jgi:hypothetical protein
MPNAVTLATALLVLVTGVSAQEPPAQPSATPAQRISCEAENFDF